MFCICPYQSEKFTLYRNFVICEVLLNWVHLVFLEREYIGCCHCFNFKFLINKSIFQLCTTWSFGLTTCHECLGCCLSTQGKSLSTGWAMFWLLPGVSLVSERVHEPPIRWIFLGKPFPWVARIFLPQDWGNWVVQRVYEVYGISYLVWTIKVGCHTSKGFGSSEVMVSAVWPCNCSTCQSPKLGNDLSCSPV